MIIIVNRIVASPVGKRPRKTKPDTLVLLTFSGIPEVISDKGSMMIDAANNPEAAKEIVFTGGQSLVMIDPMA